MSTSFLQKSLKLFEDDKPNKGNKKGKNKQGIRRNIDKHSRKKKQLIIQSERKEQIIKENVKRNLKALKRNRCPVPQELSKKVINLVNKSEDFIKLETKKEEGTVFTEEDFLKFEAEYFGQ